MSGSREDPAGRVAAIVPALDEEKTLAGVLEALLATPLVDEIVVVSDGSADGTVELARSRGVKTIHLQRNFGKGVAMAVGVAAIDAPILVFVDGDILNLGEGMLRELISPVLEGRAAMNVGVRHRGSLLNAIQRHAGPLLSGIRCLRREIFEAVPNGYRHGYRIETALNHSCRALGHRPVTTVLRRLEHRVKERKRGLIRGLRLRFTMFASVFWAWLTLRLGWHRSPARADRRPAEGELEYFNFTGC